MEDVEIIDVKELKREVTSVDAADSLPRGEEEFPGEDATGGEEPGQPVFTNYRVKIVEIIKNLHSPEIKIYSGASKEFIDLLRGEAGGGILVEYIQLAPKCSEILEAWRIHQGKPGMVHILSLVSVILDHPDGKSRASGVGKHLDSFARLLVNTKLTDIYTEMNCQESRRQSAALDLLASIVKRGGRLASEVARIFDFKLPVISKLSGLQKKGREDRHGLKRSTRRAFVGFAMSFIEVGSPRLLRWILQQRELYSGVLRGLGSDEFETIIYVLSTLKNKVLVEDSLLPPALRSVLLGSTTLEQLSYISGNPMAGHAADIAHEVLVMACTDPNNGLMPGVKLKGNEKRLFDLMKKLKATEVGYHRELLLAIVTKRPSLSAAYMDEFPYHLEPRSSSSWFTAISLAADVISSVNTEAVIMSFTYVPKHLPGMVSEELQRIFKNIIPRVCNRLLLNKGLLHADILVKHGSLRLLIESLKSVGSLIMRIDDSIKSNCLRTTVDSHSKEIGEVHGLPGICCFARVDEFINNAVSPHIGTVGSEKWVSLRQYIQDEVRSLLPDPQVLLKLLSSLSYKHSVKRAKRTTILPEVSGKRMKTGISMDDDDIIIGGMDTGPTNVPSSHQNVAKDAGHVSELDGDKDCRAIVAEIWRLNKQKMMTCEAVDEQDFFYSRLLDALALYMNILPSAFEGSFDFFKILPSNALHLPTDQQQSLLSLLVESIGQSPGGTASAPDFMYKHLQPLVNLLIYSASNGIRDQAYVLAKASLISTGAFDENLSEVDAWLISLPGYQKTLEPSMENQGAGTIHSLYAVVISFLCDAISTVGNNLYKHHDQMHNLISNIENVEDDCPGFSPLVICILQKCLRLLESDSGTFRLYERVFVSSYVSSALKLILQSQADKKILPGLIEMLLCEKFVDDSKTSLCEWRPLKKLLLLSQDLLNRQRCTLYPVTQSIPEGYSSFQLIRAKLMEFIGGKHADKQYEIAFAFLSSIICAPLKDVVTNLHLILTIAPLHFGSYIQSLSYLLFLEPNFLAEVVNLWPDMFNSSLEKLIGMVGNDCRKNSDHAVYRNDCFHSFGLSLISDNLVSKESAATVFSFFLRHAPFYALLEALVCLGSYPSCSTRILELLHSPTVADLLKVKVTEGTMDDLVLFLRCVLFWAHWILSSYKTEPSIVKEELFQFCFILLDCIIEQFLVDSTHAVDPVNAERSSSSKYIQDVVDAIVHHPLVECSVSDPICCGRDIAKDEVHNSIDSLLTYSKQNLHRMDHLVLKLLTKVLENFVHGTSGSQCSSQTHVFDESFLKPSRHLVQKILLLFREKFGVCAERRDFNALLPYFYIFHSMMHFVSPFNLLELAHWMFSKIESNVSGCAPVLLSPVSFCLSIADGALDLLFGYLTQSSSTFEPCDLYGIDVKGFDASILQKIYDRILELVVCSDTRSASTCLLKVFNFVCNHGALNPPPSSLPLCMLFSRMVIHSPMKLFLSCLCPTDKVKAKILSLFLEVSPLHMNLFGRLFLGILNKDTSVLSFLNVNDAWPLRNTVVDKNKYFLSEDDFVILLPAALSYYTSHRRDLQDIGSIPIFYSEILLGNFSNWKNFISCSIFEEEYPKQPFMSFEDFHTYFNSSLLGKAIVMLHYFFILNASSVAKKRRLKIFESIYPHSFELLDDDLKKLNECSSQESLKLIVELFAKISFTRLLFSPAESLIKLLGLETGEFNEIIQEESKSLNRAKLRFMTILVGSLDQIVRMFPLENGSSLKSCTSDRYNICCFFEHYILKNIIELTVESKGYLDHLPSIPFVNHFVRSSLLHRFEDPATLKAIRCFFAALSERTFSPSEILGLLLGHSQFVSTILLSDACSDSSGLVVNESLLQPLPSILRFMDISYDGHISSDFRVTTSSGLEARRLELIKLLRVLYHKHKEENVGSENFDRKDSRELLVLLLSAYGATCCETDLEILHLMHEIESTEGSDCEMIAEMDYLWGASVIKMKKDRMLEWQSSSTMGSCCELTEDSHKMLFRDNIPVDVIKCLMTILHFCHDGFSSTAPQSVESLLQDKFVHIKEQSSEVDSIPGYDPAFILKFSLHSLVLEFIEPIEFSQLGLLAIAFASIASPAEELRRLGYEVLGRFKLALESSQRNKDSLQLELLLTYIQNGITEPWEKVPSIFAIFAAEASFILLDPRQTHFFTISKLLMNSPNMNFKSVPLFHAFFESSSHHFNMERTWILQLLHAGINYTDDAEVYRRNKIFEVLLSLHASSMSDPQFGFIILQVVKKSVKQPILADYLVKECGLLSWLFSVLSNSCGRLHGDLKQFSLRVLELVLMVVNDVLSSKSISEWLQERALEQLSELSSHLHVLFVNDLKLLKENVSVVKLMLHAMMSTIRLSNKRTINQPRFTISLEGLFNLHLSINAELSTMKCAEVSELAAMIILMSTPMPVVSKLDKARLVKLVKWTLSTSLHSSSSKKYLYLESYPHLLLARLEQHENGSLLSKLLRWTTASVILGSILNKSFNMRTEFSLKRSSFETLQPLLEFLTRENNNIGDDSSSANEALAVLIIYLQQVLRKSSIDHRSVISALCLLLLSDGSNVAGKDYLAENYTRIALLCSKIRCPVEVNPAWRWSFDQPWKDVTVKQTEIEQLEEEHACYKLLNIFSSALDRKQYDCPTLSDLDL